MAETTLKQKKDNRALLLFTGAGRENEPVEQAIPVKNILHIIPVNDANSFGFAIPTGIKTAIVTTDNTYPQYAFEDVQTLVNRANRDDAMVRVDDVVAAMKASGSDTEALVAIWEVLMKAEKAK